MIKSITGIAFDCPNADELAEFYVRLTGWEKIITNDEWAALKTPQGMLFVCQTVADYTPPVWPWEKDKQQQMAHVDLLVDDLNEAVDHAVKCGAKKSEVQYFETSIVMFDPAGHTFCLTTVE